LPAAQAWGVSSNSRTNAFETMRRIGILSNAAANLAWGSWLEKRPARFKLLP
jgi:hypothetical protein